MHTPTYICIHTYSIQICMCIYTYIYYTNMYIYNTKGLGICRVSVLFIVFCCIKFPSSPLWKEIHGGKCVLGVLGTLSITHAHLPPNKGIENTQNSQGHTFSKSNTSKGWALAKNTYSQITPNSWKLSIPFQC